ncbi:hypothetical protein RJ641_030061 [Dillenia turbinata]|uniref:Uncharacterized protein n=1 Tax=Dillenia turbinata TaxID=194707 RepID=A0AAN8ZNN8_9MAGN
MEIKFNIPKPSTPKPVESVLRNALVGALKHPTTRHAMKTATNVALNVCVFHRVLQAIRRNVHATITGRPRKEDPSALDHTNLQFRFDSKVSEKRIRLSRCLREIFI